MVFLVFLGKLGVFPFFFVFFRFFFGFFLEFPVFFVFSRVFAFFFFGFSFLKNPPAAQDFFDASELLGLRETFESFDRDDDGELTLGAGSCCGAGWR